MSFGLVMTSRGMRSRHQCPMWTLPCECNYKTLTSKSTQPQHQATPPPSLLTRDYPHAPARQPHPTSRPSQYGLPTATRFMPDDDVFRTEFQGKKLIWSIVDRVMFASACGKFRKCIFCTPNSNAKNSISMQDANYPDKRVMVRHLSSKSHTKATEEAHAACVETQFPSLPAT